jgi:ice-binding like protein
LLRSIAFIPIITRFAVLLPLLAACSAQDPQTSPDPQQDESEPAARPAGTAANSQPTGQNRPPQDPSDDGKGSDSDGRTDAADPAQADDGDSASMVSVDESMQQATSAGKSSASPAAVQLRSAGTYTILAQSAVTNVPPSVITGDIGISPAAASSITGFPFTNAGDNLTTPQVIGEVFAADLLTPTPSDLTAAVADMLTAFNDAAGRTNPTFSELGAGEIGGLTLTPGVYKWTSVVSVSSDVTISGTANDVWIFQVSKDLTLSAGKKMTLTSGAQAKNIVWQVAGAVDLGTTSHAEGIMLSKTAIHMKTGSSIKGRLLAQTAVTLEQSTVTEP